MIELGPREQPAWIVRYGIWALLGCFVALFAAAEVIPFANVVTAPVHFDSGTSLASAGGGRIHLLVRDGEIVSAGQRIAVLDRSQPVTTAVILVTRSAALSIRPPQAAIVETGGRRIAATITAVLPAEGDRVPLRVAVSSPLPPGARGTVSIVLERSHLLPQLLKSGTSQ
ncbi:MAG TPA: hypothetical protein VF713_18165 [Thermoanaerobaculia bacterium]